MVYFPAVDSYPNTIPVLPNLKEQKVLYMNRSSEAN